MTEQAVLFIADLVRELRVSRTTIEKLRRFGCFPIPELRSLDKRPRWSRAAVDAFLADDAAQSSVRPRRRGRFLLHSTGR